MHFLQGVVYTVVGLITTAVTALFTFQEKLLYIPGIPSRQYEQTPADHAMQFESVQISAHDGEILHAWLILRPDSKRVPTFIYCHGNTLMDARGIYDTNFNVLMISYRGYGESTGSPSERNFKRDTVSVVDYIRTRTDVIDTERLFMFGRSIGGAVAIAAATSSSAPALAGVVVENTFTSIGDMIDVVLPPLRFFKFLNRNPWVSVRAVRNLTLPILVISGLRDELVPPGHSEQLYAAAVASRLRRFFAVPGGTHNDTWYVGGDAYRSAIRSFVDEVLALGQGMCST